MANFFSLSDDERAILQFLWRVKVAPTSAIFLRFEPEFRWKPFTAYKRLLILKSKGCIITRTDESGTFRAWGLTAKGFKAIRHLLLALKEDGYASECVKHDLYTLAAHYGEWIGKGSADDVRFVTEQELRRIDADELPGWAKPLQTHKPDGAWYFPESESKTLYALEMEPSRKRGRDYSALGAFYSEEKSIGSVLWIVQSRGHANAIVRAMQSATNEYRNVHNFVLLEDLEKTGWASRIFYGPCADMSIHSYLAKARGNQSSTKSSPTHHRGYVQKMLNFRIRRFESNTSAPSFMPPKL